MSAGTEHCHIKKHGAETAVQCKHCDWGKRYDDPVVARRMASNHVVKRHPDIAKPASQQVATEKRPYNRKPKPAALGVNFCPQCGCHLNAVRVALSL